jgi:hypothetical protein
MASSPLVDVPRLARDLEVAYRAMWREWCSGPSRKSAMSEPRP